MKDRWQPEMRIVVEQRDRNLLELLFVRSTWELLPDEPVLDPTPDPGTSTRPDEPDKATWETWWREAWTLTWNTRLTTPSGAPPLAAGLQPTSWIAQFGDNGIDTDALARWVDLFTPDLRARLDTQPERRNIAALTSAWESGLDTIVVLPYKAPYAERLSTRHLAISTTVRNQPELYNNALDLR